MTDNTEAHGLSDIETRRTDDAEVRRETEAEARRKVEAEEDRNDDAGNDDSDNVWGGENCAREAGVPIQKFYYLFEIGALTGVVRKLSHKTLVGSRRGLRNLAVGS
jgi:hypothetical protein